MRDKSMILGPSFYEKDGEVWFRYTIDQNSVFEQKANDQHKRGNPVIWAEFEKTLPKPEPELLPSEKRRRA